MPQEQGDITVVDNVSATITSRIRGTGTGDDRPDYGTVRTTISSAVGGDGRTVFRMNTSDSSYAPDDASAALAELTEFAADMAAHWNKVADKLAQVAPGSDSDSDPDQP